MWTQGTETNIELARTEGHETNIEISFWRDVLDSYSMLGYLGLVRVPC